MNEARSHGLSPVQSAELAIPLVPSALVGSSVDVDHTLQVWDPHIMKVAGAVARRVGAFDGDADDFAQAGRLALARVAADRGEGYKKRVIRNAIFDAARRERRGFRSLAGGREELNEAVLRVGDNDLSDVTECVARLPQRLRDVYDLLYIQGFTQREAATRLQVTQPRITQLHTELKRSVRNQLLENDPPSNSALLSGRSRAA
jgi:RNA polymerase sigma factor (sigma-70 family)